MSGTGTAHVSEGLADCRPDDVRALNKTGVEQMRLGDLEASLATLQLALSLTTTITAAHQQSAVGGGGGGEAVTAVDSIVSDDLLSNAMKAAKATTLCNLGCIFRRMGKLAESMRHLQLARDLECKMMGSRGHASVTTMLNLCTVLLAMGRVDEALASAHQCAERAEEDHKEAAECGAGGAGPSASNAGYLFALALHNLAVAQQSSDNREARRHAATTMLRALEVARAALGDAHATTVMLRVKCGVPNIPHAQQATSTPTTMLVPQAPAGGKPKQQPFAPSTGRRNEAEAARQALRQMSPTMTMSGNDAIAAMTRGASASTAGNKATTTTAASHNAAAPSQESLVMEGAAFSDVAPDPQEGAKTTAAAADGTTTTTAYLDLAARLQSTEEQRGGGGGSGSGSTGVVVVGEGTVADAVGMSSGAAASDTGLVVTTTAGAGAGAAEEDAVVVATPTTVNDAPAAAPRGAAPLPATAHQHEGTTLRVTPSYQSHHGSGTASPSPSHARPSSKASSSATGAGPVGGYTLVLQRTGTSLDRPPSFMRFAPYATAPPPPPTTFTEIREELRAEREQRRQAAVMQERADGKRPGGGTSSEGRHMASEALRMVAAVAERKKRRAVQEEAEERLLRERLHAEEQQARIEDARRQRTQAIRNELEHHAARRIQRCYRAWWHRTGYNKSMQRKKVKSANNTAGGKVAQPPAPQQRGTKPFTSPSSGALSGSGAQPRSLHHSQQDAGTRLSRVVMRCAQKWHRRCFGQLLVLRLSAGKSEGLHRIEQLTRRIQRCWRMTLARRRLAALRALRDACNGAITTMERRSRAARRIQAMVRVFQARRLKTERKQAHYWRHVVAIQRWFRCLRTARLNAGQRAHRVFYRSQAAVVIQRVWRGYTGRLRAVMVRLKRKLAVARQAEHSRSIAVQRVARGFQVRRTASKARDAAKHSQSTKAAAMIAALANKPLAVMATALQPSLAAYQTYVARAPERAPGVDRLSIHEREAHHVPLVLDAQAARHRASYERINALDVRRARAGEELTRDKELKTLIRHRAARLIQRTFRRWKHLATPGGAAQRVIAARTYERTVIHQRSTARVEAQERDRLRKTVVDLGADARMLVVEGKREIAELEPTVATHVSPPSAVRPQDVRADDVKSVKEKEHRLLHQQAIDNASLRAVPTFMTQKQRRQLVERREHDGAAQHQRLVTEGGMQQRE